MTPFADAEKLTSVQAVVRREEDESLLERLRKNPAALEECIESLTPKRKAVFLDLITGRDESQTRQALGITEVNYRKLTSRARANVRECLASKGFSLKDLPMFLNAIRKLQNELNNSRAQSPFEGEE